MTESAPEYDTEAKQLLRDLEGHDAVRDTDLDTDRRPHQLAVYITDGCIPDGVRDILDAHQAKVEDVKAASDLLTLKVIPGRMWKPAGQRVVRSHGGSMVCTLTREALDVSGLGEDDAVDLEARDGQVRISRREA